ncbi:MAG: hypothetical protein JO013_12850 [Alphaproteobacteria bacterium]|nr:hypothetical protein [Alphaproteobacteria bacterium]
MKLSDWLAVGGFATTIFALGAGWAHFSDRMDKQDEVIAALKKAQTPALTYSQTICVGILNNLNASYRSSDPSASVRLEALAREYHCETGGRNQSRDPDSKVAS